eukprot:15324420-Ditylum_brightwellii.AAC.1
MMDIVCWKGRNGMHDYFWGRNIVKRFQQCLLFLSKPTFLIMCSRFLSGRQEKQGTMDIITYTNAM